MINKTSAKRRQHAVIAFEMVRLDRTASEPLHQQLFRQIRDELKSGNFNARSSRLPSSRALAADLKISRLTVELAFSKLHGEGYVEAKRGSGTFIAERLPEVFLTAKRATSATKRQRPPRIARRIGQIPDPRVGKEFNLGATHAGPGTSLIPGIPAIDEFPIAIWERIRARILASKGARLLRYGSSRGEVELREALAAYLCDFRGARCQADQIVITAGTQQALMLSALALVNQGELVWIEDPGFHQARRVFAFAGATVVPRPIDQDGIVIAKASRKNPPRLIFVTPSHQFPLGITMSLARRHELLGFARANNAFVFEDDYNSEFRFNGPPLPCLQGLDGGGSVIYAGTMSKILFPSLRLGYLVVPEQLLDPMMKIRSVMDQHSPTIDQVTLAHFITEGFFLSHIKRMRKLYAERREFFVREFNDLLGKHFTLDVPEGGLHLVAWLRDEAEFALVDDLRTKMQVRPSALSFFCVKAKLPPAFVFGFAAWSRAQIRESLAKLAVGLKQRR